jgi:Helix-turn-helix domain
MGKKHNTCRVWMSRQEAADYLGVSWATMDYYVKRGFVEVCELPPVAGRKPIIRISKASLDKLLKQRKNNADKPLILDGKIDKIDCMGNRAPGGAHV